MAQDAIWKGIIRELEGEATKMNERAEMKDDLQRGDLITLCSDMNDNIITYAVGETGNPKMTHREGVPCIYLDDEDCSNWKECASTRFIVVLCEGQIRTFGAHHAKFLGETE